MENILRIKGECRRGKRTGRCGTEGFRPENNNNSSVLSLVARPPAIGNTPFEFQRERSLRTAHHTALGR